MQKCANEFKLLIDDLPLPSCSTISMCQIAIDGLMWVEQNAAFLQQDVIS